MAPPSTPHFPSPISTPPFLSPVSYSPSPHLPQVPRLLLPSSFFPSSASTLRMLPSSLLPLSSFPIFIFLSKIISQYVAMMPHFIFLFSTFICFALGMLLYFSHIISIIIPLIIFLIIFLIIYLVSIFLVFSLLSLLLSFVLSFVLSLLLSPHYLSILPLLQHKTLVSTMWETT